jgi:hypothetical protein
MYPKCIDRGFIDGLQAKALEKDALLQDMTTQLKHLQKEKEDLRNQNIALESHFAALNSSLRLCLLNGFEDQHDEVTSASLRAHE